VDGLVSVFDLQHPLQIRLEDAPNYDTLAGLVLNELGRMPEQGETLDWQGFRLICEQVTRTAVLQVRIIPPLSRQSSRPLPPPQTDRQK